MYSTVIYPFKTDYRICKPKSMEDYYELYSQYSWALADLKFPDRDYIDEGVMRREQKTNDPDTDLLYAEWYWMNNFRNFLESKKVMNFRFPKIERDWDNDTVKVYFGGKNLMCFFEISLEHVKNKEEQIVILFCTNHSYPAGTIIKLSYFDQIPDSFIIFMDLRFQDHVLNPIR